jgi:hypothetical protein
LARHNRTGKGTDQSGQTYEVRYQPDWLRRVKVTRDLESGRQSTMSMFRNPANTRQAEPGDQVKGGITSTEEDVDFDVVIHDPKGRVTKVSVTYELPASAPARGRGRSKRPPPPTEVVFTFENGLKAPPSSK